MNDAQIIITIFKIEWVLHTHEFLIENKSPEVLANELECFYLNVIKEIEEQHKKVGNGLYELISLYWCHATYSSDPVPPLR